MDDAEAAGMAVQQGDAVPIIDAAVGADDIIERAAIFGDADRHRTIIGMNARDDVVQPLRIDFPAHRRDRRAFMRLSPAEAAAGGSSASG